MIITTLAFFLLCPDQKKRFHILLITPYMDESHALLVYFTCIWINYLKTWRQRNGFCHCSLLRGTKNWGVHSYLTSDHYGASCSINFLPFQWVHKFWLRDGPSWAESFKALICSFKYFSSILLILIRYFTSDRYFFPLKWKYSKIQLIFEIGEGSRWWPVRFLFCWVGHADVR